MNTVVLRIRQEEYILAARSLGAGHLQLIFRHLIPNSISPAIVLAARDVGYLVLLQAGFTFIGLSHGSEWGVLLSLGRNYVIGPGGNPFTWWWAYCQSGQLRRATGHDGRRGHRHRHRHSQPYASAHVHRYRLRGDDRKRGRGCRDTAVLAVRAKVQTYFRAE